eukprot:TRINITY_DN6961_c0_g1_i2.p1 TRINITY_DN6961_c0_g1~~TRINITY_DN6961_c0_g1_i2.p1  ORF type:complete len:407 (+),score=75.87 TRINITY_DN6961_c0_g1_i2:74-1222(+)
MGAAWCGCVDGPTPGGALQQPHPSALPAAVKAERLGLKRGLRPSNAECAARAEMEAEEACARAELGENQGRAAVAVWEAHTRVGIASALALKTCTAPRRREVDVPGPHEVSLSVYSLGPVGYHSAVVVIGRELYYGGHEAAGAPPHLANRTGVLSCRPERGPIGAFYARLPMGQSALSSVAARRAITGMMAEWTRAAYHLLQHNCNHFAEAALAALGCPGRPPAWVNRTADWVDRYVPDELFSWYLRVVGAQRQGPAGGARWRCSCGARCGVCQRRTDCGACGGAFCGDCTSRRRVVPLQGARPVRVCGGCAAPLPEPPAPAAAAPAAAAGNAMSSAAGAAAHCRPEQPRAHSAATVSLCVAARRANLEAPASGRCSPAGSC